MSLLQIIEDVFSASGCDVATRAELEGRSGSTYTVPALASREGHRVVVVVVEDRTVTVRDVRWLGDVASDLGTRACLIGLAGVDDDAASAATEGPVDAWTREDLETEFGRAVVARALEGPSDVPRIRVRPPADALTTRDEPPTEASVDPVPDGTDETLEALAHAAVAADALERLEAAAEPADDMLARAEAAADALGSTPDEPEPEVRPEPIGAEAGRGDDDVVEVTVEPAAPPEEDDAPTAEPEPTPEPQDAPPFEAVEMVSIETGDDPPEVADAPEPEPAEAQAPTSGDWVVDDDADAEIMISDRSARTTVEHTPDPEPAPTPPADGPTEGPAPDDEPVGDGDATDEGPAIDPQEMLARLAALEAAGETDAEVDGAEAAPATEPDEIPMPEPPTDEPGPEAPAEPAEAASAGEWTNDPDADAEIMIGRKSAKEPQPDATVPTGPEPSVAPSSGGWSADPDADAEIMISSRSDAPSEPEAADEPAPPAATEVETTAPPSEAGPTDADPGSDGPASASSGDWTAYPDADASIMISGRDDPPDEPEDAQTTPSTGSWPAVDDGSDAEILPGRAATSEVEPPKSDAREPAPETDPEPPRAARARPSPPPRLADGAFMVGPTVLPRVDVDGAIERATKMTTGAREAVLQLVPHRVFSYNAIVEGGPVRREESGTVWVNAVDGTVLEPADLETVDELDRAYHELEPRLDEAACIERVQSALDQALSRRETYEKDFGETKLIERVEVAPVSDSIRVKDSGRVLVPRYRVEADSGVVFVNGVTGDVST